MGILRTDRVSGLGGASAIKGSVLFSEKQYFKIDNHEDFQFGTGDWTIEYWWNASSGTGTNNHNYNSVINTLVVSAEAGTWRVGHTFAGNNRIYFARGTGSGFTDVTFDVNVNDGEWHHIAFVRSSNTIIPFVDGVDRTADKTSGSVSDGNNMTTTNPVVIGYNSRDDDYIHGHLSNLRVIKGTAVYTSNFTPPTGELQKLSGTSLLCFQSPGNILKEETGKILQPYRDGYSAEDQAGSNSTYAVATRFTPNSPVGFSTTTDVGTQFGTTFDGVTTFDSQAYMVPPGGNTRERNRGRGIYGLGGFPSYVSTIDFLSIQSTGNAQVFGDLTEAASFMGAAGNQTRSVFSRRYGSGGGTNTMDFVTIATTSNATDFGDATTTAHAPAGCGNNTRGLFGGGATTNILEFITFATAGNAQDFGDLYSKRDMGGLSNSTRGVFAGGGDAPQVNTIQFVTISTTGNGSDFGDLTQETQGLTGSSNSTRGIFAGGYTPTMQNTIQFITIATTGNATDFGDLTFTSFRGASCSSPTRSVIMRGWSSGGNVNDICFITISTSGNAQDFGDKTSPSGQMSESGTSDCHGGLS